MYRNSRINIFRNLNSVGAARSTVPKKAGKFQKSLNAFSKSGKKLTLINKENHFNFGTKIFATAN